MLSIMFLLQVRQDLRGPSVPRRAGQRRQPLRPPRVQAVRHPPLARNTVGPREGDSEVPGGQDCRGRVPQAD